MLLVDACEILSNPRMGIKLFLKDPVYFVQRRTTTQPVEKSTADAGFFFNLRSDADVRDVVSHQRSPKRFNAT